MVQIEKVKGGDGYYIYINGHHITYVGHNGPFVMSVIGETLGALGLEYEVVEEKPKIDRTKLKEEAHAFRQEVHDRLKAFDHAPKCNLIFRCRED